MGTTQENQNLSDALMVIESYLIAEGGDEEIENWDGQTARTLLEEIKYLLNRK